MASFIIIIIIMIIILILIFWEGRGWQSSEGRSCAKDFLFECSVEAWPVRIGEWGRLRFGQVPLGVAYICQPSFAKGAVRVLVGCGRSCAPAIFVSQN